ncbi:small multidrug efflux protein [Occultella kanbiaonis]|uniref:small multidrug efflux protein n=1 Tax=Occultella kanbiaonis TaxID=2675754 RepID=UPI0013D000EA|nr:small multidrug efflux protein [Occultella kanbiaonis]
MNVVEFLQNLMSQVPFFIQPLIVAAAAAIPFVEGELASVLGVWAGLNPFIAAGAAVAGNFTSVVVVVFFGAGIRAGIVSRRARRSELVTVGRPVAADADGPDGSVDEAKPESKGVRRFKTFLVRFGVPGASLLGPLAIPTQFTSALLVSTGVAKGWVLLWQAVAIMFWTTLTTLIATGVLAFVTG